MKTKLMWILVGIAALGLHAGMAAATETQLPEECLEPNLPKEVQRFCDQLRFADVPHYHVVRYAPAGAVRSIHLIDTVTGREIVTSYPHGIKFAIADELTPGESDREVRVRTEALQGALEGQPTPAPPVPAPVGFATGLPIGWNSSTGLTPGQCLNYTIAPLSNNVEQASFDSQNTANSTAEQINVSATVSLAFDLFSASDTFSFSDQWQSSTNSSNQYYNFYSLSTLNSTVPPSNPLNAQGQNAGTSFNTLCGSDYLSSVPVGMVATISINYGSTSQSTQQSITNTLNVSFGLDSVSTAVGTASQDTSSSSYFTFSMQTYGGGTAATAALHNAFAAENAMGEAFYALCAQGNVQACTQFTSSMGQGAAAALNSFNQQVAGLSGATNPDLSFLQTFPSGVAGASIPHAVTTPIPLQTSDVLAPYKPQLMEVLTLMNQISTLNNRVSLLQGLLSNTISFNPAAAARSCELSEPLAKHLQGRSQHAAHQSAELPERDQRQRHVGLPVDYRQSGDQCLRVLRSEWTGQRLLCPAEHARAAVYCPPPGPAPDCRWTFSTSTSCRHLGLTPRLRVRQRSWGFVDRPVPDGAGGFLLLSFVDILALEPDAPLSTNNVSTKVRANPAASSPFTLWIVGEGVGSFPHPT